LHATVTLAYSCYTDVDYYPHDVLSAVYATATWVAGWMAGCHMPVLYQNG